jgi:hypothetical protein
MLAMTSSPVTGPGNRNVPEPQKSKRPFPVSGNGLEENERISFSKPFPYAGIAQIRYSGFFLSPALTGHP